MNTDRRLEVVFVAQIQLDAHDIKEAEGDIAQAVQNRIGHTGAVVEDIDDSWEVGPDA